VNVAQLHEPGDTIWRFGRADAALPAGPFDTQPPGWSISLPTDLAVAADATHDHTLRLRDGRALGYAEYGDPTGTPWIFHHGAGDCRQLIATMSDAATKNGIRLIAPDRWGISLSDPRPGGTLLDWPDDVQELADALGIPKFVVSGGGGGAAFG